MKPLRKIFKFSALFVAALSLLWGGGFAYQYHALAQSPLYQPANLHVPVLMYHEIAVVSNCEWSLPVENFKKQMEYLKKAGYTTLTVDSFYEHLKSNTPFPEKAVILTFDDAWTGQYEYAAPILKENGFTATFYVPTGNVDSKKPVDPYGQIMGWNQIRELNQMGFDIESHTVYHRKLVKVDPVTAFKELLCSRLSLERELKKPVRHIAYPSGRYNPFVESLAVIAGYKTAALTSRLSDWRVPHFVRIKRKGIMPATTDADFKALLEKLAYFDHLK